MYFFRFNCSFFFLEFLSAFLCITWLLGLRRYTRFQKKNEHFLLLNKLLNVQYEAKVHVTGNVYRHNPYTHYT